MIHSVGTNGLKGLRRYRGPLAWLAVALILCSPAATFGQCLAMGTMFLGGSLASEVSQASMIPGEMPCANCTAGGNGGLLDQQPISMPADTKPVIAFALVLLSSLLALNFPKTIPIPRRPHFAVRPRTLKFCVLRI